MNLRSLRGFRAFSLANWRELIRDPLTLLLITLPPLMIVGVFFMVNGLLNEKRPVTLVVPRSAEPAVHQVVDLLTQVSQLSFEVVDEDQGAARKAKGSYSALVTLPARLDGGAISVEAPAESDVQVWLIESLLAQATRKAGSPLISVQTSGGQYFDPVRFGLVGSLVYALASLGIFGIAPPIINMRQRGVLRLLRTTPLTRLTFVLAQIPARLGIAAVMTLLGVVAVGVSWDVGLLSLVAAFFTALLGFVMLASLGYLAGGVMSNYQGAFGLLSFLMPLVMMLSDAITPMRTMPVPFLRELPRFVPIAYLSDALRQHLGGAVGKPIAPLWVEYAVIIGTALVATGLAVRLFQWDQAEERMRRST